MVANKKSQNKFLFFGFLAAILTLVIVSTKTPGLSKLTKSQEFDSSIQFDQLDRLDRLNAFSSEIKPIIIQLSPDVKKRDLKSDLKILFVGDIMLARAVGDQINEHQDNNYPFNYVIDFLKKADLTFGNLEGPVSNQGRDLGHLYSFRAEPKTLDGLAAAGFDILSLANNHSYDWGPEALIDTIDNLRAQNIAPLGAGTNYQEAYRPIIIEINGQKIAFFAATNIPPKNAEAGEFKAGIAWMRLKIFEQKINQIKSQVDFTVVSMHSGTEYQNYSNSTQQNFARKMIDAGADLIIGHHPHVVQELEKYQNGYIFYSLGNFIFDQNWSNETAIGQVVEIKLNRELKEINVYRSQISPQTFQPKIQLDSKKQIFSQDN